MTPLSTVFVALTVVAVAGLLRAAAQPCARFDPASDGPAKLTTLPIPGNEARSQAA